MGSGVAECDVGDHAIDEQEIVALIDLDGAGLDICVDWICGLCGTDYVGRENR